MPHNQNPSNDNRLQKENDEKKRKELEYFNLLISLVNEEAVLGLLRFQQSQDESSKDIFEKNINHAFALLAAAYEEVQNSGRTLTTDYLITSALSVVADNLSAQSVKNIVNKLDEFNRSRSTDNEKTSENSSKKSSVQTAKQTSEVSTKQTKADKKFNELISSVRNTLLSSKADAIPNSKQIVIDFAADKLPYREYGIKAAKRLGANLIQMQPDQFSETHQKFVISEKTHLTLIGHCGRGLDYLSDNSGNVVFASEIANKIFQNMRQHDTPFDTEFTIDLIACQAARSDGNRSSFAETLVEELSARGIKKVKVSASPTIMLATPDGRQANLSFQEDQKESEQLQRPQDKNFFRKFFSSSHDSLYVKVSELKLNVNKVTFGTNNSGNVVRIK